MTETSFYWDNSATGDGSLSPYDNDEFSDIWRKLLQNDRTVQGYINGYANELAITNPSGSTIRVASGAALVDGKFYETDVDVDNSVSTPSVSTRIDRIVLRKSWAAQTVRVAVLAGVEGGGVPALTQTDGVTWEIPLAQVSITTGGAITLTDERQSSITPLIGSNTGTVMEEIETIDGDGIIVSFDFQSIPQTFKHLQIIGTARILTAVITATLQMRLNNDSGANYNEQTLFGANVTPTATNVIAGNEVSIAFIPGATGIANHVSQFDILIPNYRQTTFYKTINSQFIHIPNVTAADLDVGQFGGLWESTSAINRITLLNSSAGALITDVRATLYGIN